MSDDYNYDNAEHDFHYETSGASHEEAQHEEECDWIYGNCNCKLAMEDYQ